MLTRLYCDNYKCLVNFEFRPKPLQLLMGRNGAGKSTIFEILALLRDFAALGEPSKDCFGDERSFMGKTRTRWQDVSQQRFELGVTSDAGEYVYKLLVEEGGQPAHPKVRHESVELNGTRLFLFEKGTVSLYNDSSVSKAKFPLDQRRSGLAIVESRPENKKLSWFKNWLSRVLYIQIDPKKMGARADREAVRPTQSLDNFADWYRHLRLERGAEMEALRKSLTGVIGGFESLDLKDVGLNTRVLQVGSRIDGKPVQYHFGELSDGQRSLVGLYSLIHCLPGHESLLCIDEPDNFVALAEIQPWLSLLRDAQENGLQVMVASHHPELLNQLAPDNGVVFDRIDGRHTLVRPFSVSEEDSVLSPAEIVARGWEVEELV